MTVKIAWGITGAGCWLPESYEILGRLLKNPNVEIDLFYSEAGREVSQCYGVFKTPVPTKIPGIHEDDKISDYFAAIDQRSQKEDAENGFDYDEAFKDVIFNIDEGSSYPSAASASIGKYDFVVISPATGNTVAKLVTGIADNLISNLALMGSKSKQTKVLVVPTDFEEGEVESYLPILLHPDTCRKCGEC
ncbi:MAG: flavoprotein, partial [Candidatus Heimdallarchaeota archaeon]